MDLGKDAETWHRAFAALYVALHTHAGSGRVVIVCGLQGVGKSTWIADRADGADVIYFDAALPGARHRKPIVDIARQHGAGIEAVWVRAPLAIALERNASRTADKIVPAASVRTVAAMFEPPTTDEGFEHVTVVDVS